MTDVFPALPPPPPPQTPPSPLSDDRQIAMIVYICYLGSFCAGGVPGLVGLILAYVNRDTGPDWLKSHYRFQIRTFWIGLLYTVISLALSIVVIGIFLLIATFVWYIVRCALGLDKLLKREPYPNPESWMT